MIDQGDQRNRHRIRAPPVQSMNPERRQRHECVKRVNDRKLAVGVDEGDDQMRRASRRGRVSGNIREPLTRRDMRILGHDPDGNQSVEPIGKVERVRRVTTNKIAQTNHCIMPGRLHKVSAIFLENCTFCSIAPPADGAAAQIKYYKMSNLTIHKRGSRPQDPFG